MAQSRDAAQAVEAVKGRIPEETPEQQVLTAPVHEHRNIVLHRVSATPKFHEKARQTLFLEDIHGGSNIFCVVAAEDSLFQARLPYYIQ